MTWVIDKIREHGTERDYLLDILELWEVALVAGYEPEYVQAFSFRPEFLTTGERRTNSTRATYRPVIEQSKFHNCVRLVSGELKPIPLTKRPARAK